MCLASFTQHCICEVHLVVNSRRHHMWLLHGVNILGQSFVINHSVLNGHLDCFSFWVIIICAAVKIHVYF